MSAADRLIDRLWDAQQLLCEHPLVGKARDDVAPDLRSWPVGDDLIL
jgi:plasmid stabilization system protein ParE